MARQNGDTHQESYVPTTIRAAQLAQLKAKRDTNIIGSTVSGKKVEVDTGRDLHIQSLQDVDNFKEHSKSDGFSISSEPNFKDPTGSISASVGSKGKANSITQSAISDGILTVDGKEINTKTINTNTENTLHQLDKIFDKKKIEERQELARLFSKNAFEQLHNWQPTTKDGKVAKSIAHGVVGGKSSNSGAATTSYATKWNEGLFHIDRVDLDGISEDNKDLALADLNYDLAQSNRYNINKLREKKKYIRKDHLYSESKGIGAGITDVVGIGFSRGYGIDSEGSSYVTDQVSIGPSEFSVQSTTSDTRVLYGEQGFTGGAISISMNTGGGESYSLGPTNITESKTMNVSPEATISFSYTEKLESEVPSEYVVNDTSVDLSTYTPDQPDGVYSPPPTEPEAEIRETNDMESLENRIRAIRTQFEIED